MSTTRISTTNPATAAKATPARRRTAAKAAPAAPTAPAAPAAPTTDVAIVGTVHPKRLDLLLATAESLNAAFGAARKAEVIFVATLAAATVATGTDKALDVLRAHEVGNGKEAESSVIANPDLRRHVCQAAQRLVESSTLTPAEIDGDTVEAKVQGLAARWVTALGAITRTDINAIQKDRYAEVLGAVLEVAPDAVGTESHTAAVETAKAAKRKANVKSKEEREAEAAKAKAAAEKAAKATAKAAAKAAKVEARKALGKVALSLSVKDCGEFGALLGKEYDSEQLAAFRKAFIAAANARTAAVVVTPAPAAAEAKA